MPRKTPAESLETYAKKRKFDQTPEPSDAPSKSKSSRGARQRFVVQMHRATRLHYDFRLEDAGVLKSWAVPKGPSFDPRVKRFAAEVEDHPLDYRDFEGIIPKGNYGAGEVVVWDRGTYRLLEGTSTTDQIAHGSVKFELYGKKLRGAFALVHMKGRNGEENAWLLIKERDEHVDPSWKVEDHPQSVKSGKTLADFAKDPKAPHWTSSRPLESAKPKLTGRREKMPDVTSPMLATAIEKPFDDPSWFFELKWDGYRALARIDADGDVALVSRNGQDFTPKFPELSSLAEAFRERPLLVDGEIVVLDAHGRPSFGALQERLDRFGRAQPAKNPVTFIAFDLLYGNGRDLRAEPLERRKSALEALLTGTGPVMLSKHVVGEGTALFDVARERGLEGIVGKRAASRYVEKRSRDWVKLKLARRQETVIGGWTEARGSRKHFGALLVGVYEGDDFVYSGSVGSGFDAKRLAALAIQLEPLARRSSPFATKPKTDTPAHWVEPKLVAEVSFTEWTRDKLMRHPVFVALRSDRAPETIVREIAEEPPAAKQIPRAAGPSRSAANVKKAAGTTLDIGGRALAISNVDKVLWPADRYTKADLVAYYRAAAPYLVPELSDRPLTMERFPDGIGGESFFEKHAPKFVPDWIETVTVPSGSGNHAPIRFMLCNDEAALVWVANLAAIVLHVWTSRAATLDVPDFLFFDLDPDERCTLGTLATTALTFRDVLAEIGLRAYVKTSGGMGLHLAVPLVAGYDYPFAKGFAELVARHVNDRIPDRTSLQRMPAKRAPGTVYLDYVQVGRGKTLVAPYSARPRDGAPISMPVDWSEIEALRAKRTRGTEGEFARFTISNGPAQFPERAALWNSRKWKKQRLEAALAKARAAWS